MTVRLNRRFARRRTAAAASYAATWTVDSTGPITMGIVAAIGQIPAGQAVQVGSFTTQTDWLNTWSDGSLRHGLASFNATSTGAKALTVIANPGGSHTPTWPSASAVFVVTAGPGAGSTYTATMPSFSGTNTICNGAVARRSWVRVIPFKSGPTDHATLDVFFEVTSYASGGHDVDIIVQNVKNVAAMAAVTYTVTLNVAGSAVFTNGGASHKHWTGQLWHYSSYTGATEAVVHHDFTPWKQAKVIPSFVAVDSATYTFSGDNYKLGAPTGSYFGEMLRHQNDAGTPDRPDIQHVNEWDAVLYTHNTENARLASLKNGDAAGEWTWGFTETDGISIPKVTDAAYTAATTTQEFSGTPGAATTMGLWQIDASGFSFSGSRHGGLESIPTDVNNEHLPEPCLTPYLLTGKFFYFHSLRLHTSWAMLYATPSWEESDPRFFPGLMRGRNGAEGIVSNYGVTREFGTPLKSLVRAAWAMPDGHADKSYFIDIAQNNIDYLGYYVAYWRDNAMGGALEGFGGADGGNASSKYERDNTVSSTTSGATTAFTVIGDDSATAIANSANDHGGQTGDYVILTGFVTSGATALNGTHVGPITRTGALTFTVPVTTSTSTTSEGTYSFVTGLRMAMWRLSITSYQLDWALRTGLWTVGADAQEFVDRTVRCMTALVAGVSDTDLYTNNMGVWAWNWYPSFGYVTGDTIVWYSTLAQQVADHTDLSSGTARLFIGEATYNTFVSTTHRGNIYGFQDSAAYSVGFSDLWFNPMLAIGARRGITGAATQLARMKAVSGHPAAISARGGNNLTFDY